MRSRSGSPGEAITSTEPGCAPGSPPHEDTSITATTSKKKVKRNIPTILRCEGDQLRSNDGVEAAGDDRAMHFVIELDRGLVRAGVEIQEVERSPRGHDERARSHRRRERRSLLARQGRRPPH